MQVHAGSSPVIRTMLSLDAIRVPGFFFCSEWDARAERWASFW